MSGFCFQEGICRLLVYYCISKKRKTGSSAWNEDQNQIKFVKLTKMKTNNPNEISNDYEALLQYMA
jgi:hypothetical protein